MQRETVVQDYGNTVLDQRHKYHHLMTSLYLTLKMTTTQVVRTSVTNTSLTKDYPHPHAKQITVLLTEPHRSSSNVTDCRIAFANSLGRKHSCLHEVFISCGNLREHQDI